MTDLSFSCDARPLALALFQAAPQGEIEGFIHSLSVSKFCATRKHHFARATPQSSEMEWKPLSAVLAESLRHHMDEQKLSNAALGRKAGVSGNTIANYLKADGVTPKKGRPRSAQLAEIERIAKALGVHPLQLLTDRKELEARAKKMADLLVEHSHAGPITATSADPDFGNEQQLAA